MRYYLWLMPDPPHYEKLEAQLTDLSQIYRAPLFAPHITIASGNRPYAFHPFSAPTVSLQPAQTQNHKRRALYYPVQVAPALLEIQRHYAPEVADYFPHLSLIYGHFSSARRNAWVQKCPSYPSPIPCSSLCMVLGGKDVHKWRVIARWTLENRGDGT